MHFPYPILVADVGGTNIRLGKVDTPESNLIHLPPQLTAAHPGLESAIRAATGPASTFGSILACAAGPVVGRNVKLTNAGWTIDGPDVARALGVKQGLLFNDFEAQALSIPRLTKDWLRPIGAPRAGGPGPRLIHGPGTGLGTAALVDVGGRWLSVASEASHSDFAPVTADERTFWPFVEPVHGRITPEALISGPGLRRLHRARLASGGLPLGELDTAEIIARARADQTSEEADTVRAFWRLAARFAGDMALAFVATGGVILAGGMLPRLVDLLDPEAFRACFENKAPYAEWARRIPVWLLMESDTVLAGLAAIAAAPDRYVIDYSNRAWLAPAG